MSVLAAVPTDYYDDHKTTLFSSLSSGTSTTIVLTALQRNGSTVSWTATAGVLKVTDGSQVEHIGFNGMSVDGTTKNITLTSGGVTRDLVWNTTSWTGGGNGIKWTAGVQVELVWDARHVQQTAFKDQTQTIAALWTFTNGLTLSGTADALNHASMTTTQRNSLSGEGKMLYNSTSKTIDAYLNGGWVSLGTSTVTFPISETQGGTNQTTLTQGDILYASAANTFSKLAKDTNSTRVLTNTGASNNPAWAQVGLTTGVTGTLPVGNGGTGVTSAGSIPTTSKTVWLSGANSTTLTNPTTSTAFDTHTYTISANDLIAGVEYEWFMTIKAVHGTSTTQTFSIQTASTDRASVSFAAIGVATVYTSLHGRITGTAAAGASVEVRFSIDGTKADTAGSQGAAQYAAVNIATNGSLVLTWSTLFGTSNGSNTTTIVSSRIDKHSTTAF